MKLTKKEIKILRDCILYCQNGILNELKAIKKDNFTSDILELTLREYRMKLQEIDKKLIQTLNQKES